MIDPENGMTRHQRFALAVLLAVGLSAAATVHATSPATDGRPADAAGVARQLATHGVRLVLVGGAIGVAASLLAARFLATLLFGIGTFDPVTLIGAPLALGGAAWMAAYLPARRASRADPLVALRSE